jgi:hypothetical protein
VALLPTDSGPLRLTHKRIYILPTRRGWAFLLTLVLMLLGALNYALSLGFLFVFILGGMFHARCCMRTDSCAQCRSSRATNPRRLPVMSRASHRWC